MGETTARALAAVLVDELIDHGLDTIFGIGGTHTLQLLGAIEQAPAMRFVPARTELGAAYMAIGYARATGSPAVVLTSTGPGALNVIAALQDASWSSLPLLHLTTRIGGADFGGAVHETPHQEDLLRLASKQLVEVTADDVGLALADAVRAATSAPHGPVTLQVLAGSWGDAVPPNVPRAGEPAGPDPVSDAAPDLAELVADLERSERPVLFVGGGAARGNDRDGVLALAERLSAPILTSHQGKTIADWSHPLYLGPWATETAVRDVVARADIALVLGSKLSALGTAAWQLPLPERTYRIDLRPGAHPHYPHLRNVCAESGSSVSFLARNLSARQPWIDCAAVRDEIFERVTRTNPGELGFLRALERAPIGLQRFSADMSKADFWAMKYLTAPPGSTHAMSSYLAMGTALPMAIGMAVGSREPVLALVGDGGLQMSLAELATIADLRLAVTLLVVVDDAYGILRDNCAAVGGSTSLGVDLWNPDLSGLCQSFGIAVHEASDPVQLAEALAGSSAEPRVVLVRQEFSRTW